MLAKDTGEDGEVLSFYVTLPFKYHIILVDLVNKTMSEPSITCRGTTDKHSFLQYGCYRPQFLAIASHDTLIVTTNHGLYGMNIQSRVLEHYTNPNVTFSDHPLDGEFGQGVIGNAGPLTPIPGHEGLFIFADFHFRSIRLVDINKRTIRTLCFGDPKHYAKQKTAGDIQLCNISQPYSVMFRGNATNEIIIGNGYLITYMYLDIKGEYNG